jgi:hypothetical protein
MIYSEYSVGNTLKDDIGHMSGYLVRLIFFHLIQYFITYKFDIILNIVEFR